MAYSLSNFVPRIISQCLGLPVSELNTFRLYLSPTCAVCIVQLNYNCSVLYMFAHYNQIFMVLKILCLMQILSLKSSLLI